MGRHFPQIRTGYMLIAGSGVLPSPLVGIRLVPVFLSSEFDYIYGWTLSQRICFTHHVGSLEDSNARRGLAGMSSGLLILQAVQQQALANA